MQHSTTPHQLGQQIVQLVVTSAEPQILSQIALKIGKTLGADICLIVAGVDSAGAVPSGLWCADEALMLEPKAVSQLLSHPVVTDSLEETKPTASAISVRSYTQLGEILSVGTCIQVVTRFEGTANGMIFLGYHQPYQESRLEKEWLPIVAESVAIAFSCLEHRQQTQMNSRYQSLFKEFNEIYTGSNLNSRLDLSLAALSRALQVDRSFVLKLKYKDPIRSRNCQELPKGSAEVVSQWSANDSQAASQFTFSLSESALCQKAWRNAPQPLAITNRAELLEIVDLEASDADFPPEWLPALLAVPILGNQSGDSSSPIVLGFFVLQQQKPRRWQADEIEVVKWVASQASTDIISNQTLQRVQSLVNERTTQLKFSLDVQAKLSERMRQQIEELRHLNEVKDKFIANLSDALKHPLTKMKMATEMLKIVPEGEPRQRYLGILEQECTKEINLVNDLLTLHSLESSRSPIQPQRFELKPLMDELAATFRQEWADKGLSLELDYGDSDNTLSLYSDPESLKRILLELLTNAGKFSAADTTVTVSASGQKNQHQNQVVVTVTNTGAGISPEEQEYIFDKFQRGKNVVEATNQGTGLGLALVKLLVEHLNGTIEVANRPSEDSVSVTSFTVTLPQFQPQQVG